MEKKNTKGIARETLGTSVTWPNGSVRQGSSEVSITNRDSLQLRLTYLLYKYSVYIGPKVNHDFKICYRSYYINDNEKLTKNITIVKTETKGTKTFDKNRKLHLSK